MRNIVYLDVDIKLTKSLPIPLLTQNDSIVLSLALFDNGLPMDLSQITAASLAHKRADGKVVVTGGTVKGDNVVDFPIGGTEMAVIALVDAAAQLYSGEDRVTSIHFNYRVIEDPTGAGFIPSEDEKTLIEIVLGEGPKVIADAREATDKANQAAERAETAATTINQDLEAVRQATAESKQATTDARKATTDATNAATAANQAADAANQAKDTLTQQVSEAVTKANDATTSANAASISANQAADRANAAAEGIEGWGTALPWDPDADYVRNNIVTYNGSTWQALQPNTGTLPVEGDTWTCIARKGVDGTGAVSSVAGKGPNEDGNVELLPIDIGAATPQQIDAKVQVLKDFVIAHGLGGEIVDVAETALKGIRESGNYRTLSSGEANTFLPTTITAGYSVIDEVFIHKNGNDELHAMHRITFLEPQKDGGFKVKTMLKMDNITNPQLDTGWMDISATGGGEANVMAKAMPYSLPTTVESQKTWDLPEDSYTNAEADTLIVFHNAYYLAPTSWYTEEVNGVVKLHIPDNPFVDITENNVSIVVWRNVPVGVGTFDGSAIVPGSVTMKEIGQDVKDAIAAGGGGGGGLGNAYLNIYTLPTTTESQKTWDVPADAYDAETDTMMLYHNTGLLDTASWTLTGEAATGYQVNIPDNPETAIEDNNVIIVVLRNAPTVPDSQDISGTRLTSNSIALSKLGQDVQDKINGAATSVVVNPLPFDEFPSNYPIGYSLFDVPVADVGDWLTVFGISAIDTTPYTKLRVYTDRTVGDNAIQHLVVIDDNSKLRYISQRSSIGSVDTIFEDPSIVYGIPGIEIVNDFTTGGATKAASAETVKLLKVETDKKVQKNTIDTTNVMSNLNKWQFTKHFGEVNFTRSDVSEGVELIIPYTSAFTGTLELNLASVYANSDASGGAKIIFHLCLTPDGAIIYQEMNIISMSPRFANNFCIENIVSSAAGKYFSIPIYKRKDINPITIEATFRLSGRNLSTKDSTDIILSGVYALGGIVSNPIQQSIFTHVGNSKDGLSVAITGKGVPTDKNDTFAQMITNINAIKTGVAYYGGTIVASSNAPAFTYNDGSVAPNFPYVSVTLPFDPQLIEVWYANANNLWTTTYVASARIGVAGASTLTLYTANQVAMTTRNLRTPRSSTGTTWTFDVPIQNAGYPFTVWAFGKV